MSEPTTWSLGNTLIELAKSYGPWFVPGAILVSAFIAAAAAVLAIWHQRVIAKKRAMIEALLKKNWDQDYIRARKEFVRLREDRGALLEAAKQVDQSGDDASVIRSILNDYEITALGIKRGILDEEIFKLWFKTSFLEDHDKLRPFIEEIRQRNPRVFIELEQLASKMREQDK